MCKKCEITETEIMLGSEDTLELKMEYDGSRFYLVASVDHIDENDEVYQSNDVCEEISFCPYCGRDLIHS